MEFTPPWRETLLILSFVEKRAEVYAKDIAMGLVKMLLLLLRS